jgi:hypothetical protein
MLLIAQPKAASTSLAYTIGQIAGLKVQYGIARVKGSKNCKGFPEIQKYHNNMVVRSELFLKQTLKGKKTLFKEHLLPTDDHLKKLNKYKDRIVILLREPEATINAYNRINITLIDKDVFDFHERWQYWESVHKNAIKVYYRDLVLNYKPTMTKILKHYGLKVPKKLLPLAKKKFTGVGKARLCS